MFLEELKKNLIEIKNLANECGIKFYHFIAIALFMYISYRGLWMVIYIAAKLLNKI